MCLIFVDKFRRDNGGWKPPLYEKKWDDRSLCDYPANIVAFEEDGKTKYSGFGILISAPLFRPDTLLDPRLIGDWGLARFYEKEGLWKKHFNKGSVCRLFWFSKDNPFKEKDAELDYCYIFSNYTLRDFGTEWGNINLNEVKKPKAIASSLLIFSKKGDDDFFSQFSGNYRKIINDSLSQFTGNYRKWGNIHNGKFFVAFTDGEVKVFKDKKGFLAKDLLSDPGKENYEKKINDIFEKYFDTMR